MSRLYAFALACAVIVDASAQSAAALARGGKLYAEKCALCHQPAGTGAPPVYPPLAKSDWLLADRKRAIKVLCEGLSGPITVLGTRYVNTMPAQVLDDTEVADVLTYATNSWGNAAQPFTAEEVAAARQESAFKTYEALVKAAAYQPLPRPPRGWAVREVAPAPEFLTRLATRGDGGTVYALATSGNIYFLDAATSALQPLIRATDYLGSGDVSALGLMQDPDGRLWVVTNRRISEGEKIVQNEIVIHRTTAFESGHPVKPEVWFKVRDPFGVGGYNHGASHLALGPDGLLYVSCGSRTDGGEPGADPKYFQGGETALTASLWRLDPRAARPQPDVLARGIRNAFGFAWDAAGQLFTVSNGPDANAPEEMDAIRPGRHYGFPYQFSDWAVKRGFPYPHTPRAPEGLAFTMPVRNLGPAARGREPTLATFEPHSSPAGMIWCGDDFPEPLRRRFLITRFGNLLGAPAAPDDVGFDLLAAKMEEQSDGTWTARIETVLAPLARPIDVIRTGPGRALVLEYTRATNFKDKLGWLPGRMIELSAESR